MFEKLKSLKVKFSLITLLTYLFLVIVILLACYYRFYRNMIDFYASFGSEVLRLAMDDINIDAIPRYLSGDYDADEYAQTLEKLNRYTRRFAELYYLYAYQIAEDGTNATVIFDAETPRGEEPDHLGDTYQLEDELVKHIDELRSGLPIKPVTDHSEWGYLLTCMEPRNSNILSRTSRRSSKNMCASAGRATARH